MNNPNLVRLYSPTGHYQSVTYVWWHSRVDVQSTDLQTARAARRYSRTRLYLLELLLAETAAITNPNGWDFVETSNPLDD